MLGQDSIPITISAKVFEGNSDEWIHLKITDTTSLQVWYDSLATVTVANGFNDTVYLDSGTYKCEVLDMGANVWMPTITLNNGYVVPWGYPSYNYYLFSVPGGDLTTRSTIDVAACDNYLSPSSKHVWTSSGTYHDTIPNAMGADSIMTINLSVTSINASISQSNGVLTVAEPDANYQWLACNSGMDIYGETSQTYKPIVSGIYAVKISKNNCEQTSLCYSLVVTGVENSKLGSSIVVYPNPTSDKLYVDLGKIFHEISIIVLDANGKEMLISNGQNQQQFVLDMGCLSAGMYIIKVNADKVESSFKVLKK